MSIDALSKAGVRKNFSYGENNVYDSNEFIVSTIHQRFLLFSPDTTTPGLGFFFNYFCWDLVVGPSNGFGQGWIGPLLV